MFGSFPPSPLVGLRLQSLLGPGSRHCYGIITLIDFHAALWQPSQRKPLKPAPSVDTKRTFSAVMHIDVGNEEEVRACQKLKGSRLWVCSSHGSCEKANSVDACTVTTLDVITDFAVQAGFMNLLGWEYERVTIQPITQFRLRNRSGPQEHIRHTLGIFKENHAGFCTFGLPLWSIGEKSLLHSKPILWSGPCSRKPSD
jgi:hypothetical protein